MTVVRRHRLGIAALVLVLLAAVLVLFALDTRTWQRTMRRDDVRFRALPDHGDLWKPKTILPGNLAGLALGTDDSIAWRRALQAFWYTHIGANPQANVNLPQLRANAQSEFQNIIDNGNSASERSDAANLLGVLIITTPVAAGGQTAQLAVIKQSIGYFQQAVELDSNDTAAKQNLELILRATKPSKGPIGKDARAGFGFGKGHGTQKVGSGY